ncbi:MAG: oxygen-dependent coproporphyrinogen oxidase [Flavobacteriaceae bacterium]|nr:oxygen-dependent coproporphyrinogen oxidase [Flavobacteriaceae bacterium]
MKEKFYNYIKNLQNTITSQFEKIDGKSIFKEDIWEHPEGGGGKTRIINNGNIFEKGGVNISSVTGELPEIIKKQLKVQDSSFFACGLSLIMHPLSPMIPSIHFNIRYFEMYNKNLEISDQWFGGGIDLTPYYIFEEDINYFHQKCKIICDKFDNSLYKKYKKNCDNYFWNSHRNESRGVGGLFFDYLKKNEKVSLKNLYKFISEIGDNFLLTYIPIINKRKNINYTAEEKKWQEIRRGRYAEFNLVHDKGTLFGLKTNGRIESILSSLPPIVRWEYNFTPKKGSKEEKLIKVLKNPIDWIN